MTIGDTLCNVGSVIRLSKQKAEGCSGQKFPLLVRKGTFYKGIKSLPNYPYSVLCCGSFCRHWCSPFKIMFLMTNATIFLWHVHERLRAYSTGSVTSLVTPWISDASAISILMDMLQSSVHWDSAALWNFLTRWIRDARAIGDRSVVCTL